MPNECPEVCVLKIDNISDDIEELKNMNATQWEEIAKRPKLGPLLWFTGITVFVLGALLSAIFVQGQNTHEDVISLKVKQAKIAQTLENHERARNSDSRLRNNSVGR